MISDSFFQLTYLILEFDIFHKILLCHIILNELFLKMANILPMND